MRFYGIGRIVDFGFWILDFGFWILDFGLRIDAGAASLSVGNHLRGNFFEVIRKQKPRVAPAESGFCWRRIAQKKDRKATLCYDGREYVIHAPLHRFATNPMNIRVKETSF